MRKGRFCGSLWAMAVPPAAVPAREVYTVSRLNREVKLLLEHGLPLIWIEGEISNLARPRSGHLYFTLKDEQAQVRCAMFRGRNRLLGFEPADGMHVLARVRVSLYEPRGEYQLVVEHMEEAGDGALRRAFEALKRRLQAEGLFDAARKRPLPRLPRRIGVVTSPTGAAVRDILHVLRRRFAAIPVLIYPTSVQGEAAAGEIVAALRRAAERRECDVLILARGGGSLEDLWPFNEEAVARAIAASPIPVVTGVGHEVDFTIADFAADVRAPTPSAAAETVTPDAAEWLARMEALERRLATEIARTLEARAQRVDWLERRLAREHPGARLQRVGERVLALRDRALRAQTARLAALGHRVERAATALAAHHPGERVAALGERVAQLRHRLGRAGEARLERAAQRLGAAGRALHAVSPLATLDRGYAIVTREADGRILRDAAEARPGDAVTARLARGRLRCRVESSEPGP